MLWPAQFVPEPISGDECGLWQGRWAGLALTPAAQSKLPPAFTCPKQANLASCTGALTSAMHTSERHQVGVTAAMSPEASPPYTETTEYPAPS